jgi:hypothetical protein
MPKKPGSLAATTTLRAGFRLQAKTYQYCNARLNIHIPPFHQLQASSAETTIYLHLAARTIC